jgi:hypothetical protein
MPGIVAATRYTEVTGVTKNTVEISANSMCASATPYGTTQPGDAQRGRSRPSRPFVKKAPPKRGHFAS